MEQIDMKALETAIVYVKRIAEGNNPVNNYPAEEDSILNNPNIIRCMFFVEDVLKQVYANNGVIGAKAKKSSRADINFPVDVLEQFSYREDKSIGKLIDQIYEPAEGGLKKISAKKINEWMMAAGYVQEIYSEEFRKNIKVPTEKGESIGLRAERVVCQSTNYEYILIVYNKQAQKFLVANLEKIFNGEVI